MGSQRHLIAQHPNIFTPPFFPQRGGESIEESRDTLLIDHVPGDDAAATWLARRLSLAGYRNWCRGTAPLAGENADGTVRKLLETRARLYLPFMSAESVSDSMFLERCTIAGTKEDFVLPCRSDHHQDGRIPSRLARLVPADFSNSWGKGLDDVLEKLRALGVQPSLGSDRGCQIALRDYLPTRVTVAKPEPVFANIFPLQLPKTMLTFDLRRPLKKAEVKDLRKRWAFAEISDSCLVSFTAPPYKAIPTVKVDRVPEFLWREIRDKDGKKTYDLAKELVRRSLELVCAKKGLIFCDDRKVFYFPRHDANEWEQPIRHVDGRQTTVRLTGSRTKGWGDHASLFLYQLAPLFRPQVDFDGTWNVALRVYVRVTTTEGKPFEGKEIGRRRKVVTKSWWNKEWLARLFGVVQALETSVGVVQIGDGGRAVVMETSPMSWQCPVGLDVLSLSGMSDIGEEIASCRAGDEDSGDDDGGDD